MVQDRRASHITRQKRNGRDRSQLMGPTKTCAIQSWSIEEIELLVFLRKVELEIGQIILYKP